MQKNKLIAKAITSINADAEAVWNALTDPEKIKKYMMGAAVETDWKEGSEIIWKGEWKGKSFEDKGEIKKIIPLKTLQYTHYSPMTDEKDEPENYHTVTIEIDDDGEKTFISLTQDGVADEKAKAESEKNWNTMLESLKKILE